jgi:hypothetical protein
VARVHAVPNEPDPHHVAARLRALLEPALHSSGLTAVAARLGVSSKLLRLSIGFRDPQLSAVIVAAVARQYGLDPTWLVTGEYDAATHREALEHPTRIDHLLAQAGFRGRRVEAPPRARADREFDEVDQDHRRAD